MKLAVHILFACAVGRTLAAQEATVKLAPYFVHATHAYSPASTGAGTVEKFSAEDLAQSPDLALDDTLRQSAAFSLFRRSGSLTANPTAQGVSLRGLGPSGASRSLVLLDGIPVNDPFGGWVAWSKVLEPTLSEVRIVRGAGASTWGSAALGGTIELRSRPVTGDADQLAVTAGDFSTLGADILADRSGDAGRVRVAAETFTTDGFPLVDGPQRGAVDRDAESRHTTAQLDWSKALGPAATLSLEGRVFQEERGNGTPLQQNASREAFVSAALAGSTPAVPAWSGVIYFQRQSFQSVFSSVAADRSSETPASNQYDVPATAGGVAVSGSWVTAVGETTAGADFRTVEGETREAFLYSAGAGDFTRQRFAGGEQAFAGAFVRQTFALTKAWELSGNLRLDRWSNTDGHRLELDSATRAVLRDDHYAAERGVEWSPGLGLTGQLAPWLEAHVSATRSFRVPTLNEYYRPFRVGAVTTEANPDLGLETNTALEVGLAAKRGNATYSITPFTNALHGAVTNVTTGLNQRQRRNVPRVVVQGAEAAVRWSGEHADLRLSYLGSDARVERGDAGSAGLVGNRLPQVPRHTVAGSLGWRAGNFAATGQLRWSGEQYEDDENLLRLAAAVTADLRVSWRVRPALELFLAVENIGGSRVETGRSADGLVNIGPPRFVHGGIRWTR